MVYKMHVNTLQMQSAFNLQAIYGFFKGTVNSRNTDDVGKHTVIYNIKIRNFL